jgi:hypothetical protein
MGLGCAASILGWSEGEGVVDRPLDAPLIREAGGTAMVEKHRDAAVLDHDIHH